LNQLPNTAIYLRMTDEALKRLREKAAKARQLAEAELARRGVSTQEELKRRKHRPRDINQRAKSIVDIATGEREDHGRTTKK
jgi:hypothetical protein